MVQQRNIGRRGTAFYFDSLTDVLNYVEETERIVTGNALDVINNLRSDARNVGRAQDVSWFGTTDINLVRNPVNYLFEAELENQLDVLRSRTFSVDAIDLDQNKQIKFTEKEIGIFSFDLASLGLIPVYEFYSSLLQNIVSGNLVFSEKTEQGTLLFYHKQQDEIPEHRVDYNVAMAGYYSPILKRVVDKSELVETPDLNLIFPYRGAIEQHRVERRHKVDSKGKNMFTTTFKKSFVEIPKIEKPLPRIDLIIGVNFSAGVDAVDEMLYNSLPALAIAEKLTKSGIPFRLIGYYGGQKPSRDIWGFINLKKEGEIFNKNQLAITLSDGRFIRGMSFRAEICMQYKAGLNREISSGISAPINNVTQIKQAYLDYLATSNNPDDIRSSENPRTKIAIAGSLNQASAQQEYERVIQEISRIV
jgi:hypothetical protein